MSKVSSQVQLPLFSPLVKISIFTEPKTLKMNVLKGSAKRPATVNIVVAAKIREDQTAGALVNWFTALLWITLSISIVYRSETLAWFIVLTRVIHVVYLRRPSMPILRPSFDA